MAHAKLCDRQRKFCLNLLRGMPKRVAAVKAGYAAKSAATQASQMLALPAVQEFLQAHYKREQSEVAIERELVRRKLLGFILSDLSAIFDNDWTLLPKDQIPKKVRALIVAVKKWESAEQGASVSVKIQSQLDAIKVYLRFFPEAEKKAEALEEVAERIETDIDALIKRLEASPEDPNGSEPS